MDELLPFGFGPSNVAGNQAVEDENRSTEMPAKRKRKVVQLHAILQKYCKGFVIGNRLHLSLTSRYT